MHLAIDVREACREKRAGKGSWTYQFVSELLKSDLTVTLLTDAPLPSEWNSYKPHTINFSGGLLWHWRVAKFLRSSKSIDLYVSPTSYIVPALLGKHFPYVSIVHDLIAFRNEPHNRKATVIERLTLGRAVRFALHVFTVSESTKDDLQKHFTFLDDPKITPIFAGPLREKVEKNHPDQKTILCIATLSPRKNQKRLIEAYAALPNDLREKYHLVLAGARGWRDQDILDLVKSTRGVTWLEYVSDDEYEALLSTCTVFALPSLYEGFGMQILDALQRGIPLLISDRGSLREVAGESAMYCDPEDLSSIVVSLEQLLRDSELQASLRVSGPREAEKFSWKRTVNLFLNELQKAK